MIKAKRLQEVHEVLRSADFSDWYLRFETAHKDREELQRQDPDLLEQLVLRAGEYEDLAHAAEETYARLDGSFESLAAYEEQRVATSIAWEELDRTELELERNRQRASDLRAGVQAVRKGEQDADSQAREARLAAELRLAERLVEEWAHQVDERTKLFAAETKRRDELWRVVEEAWLTAFRANMARIEYAYLGRRARQQIEQLVRDGPAAAPVVGETRLQALAEDRARLEDQLRGLLSDAEERFACVAINEYLYWPDADDVKAALCVPLVGDMQHLNLQVHKLKVYRVERSKGLKSIEPLPESSGVADEDLNRLERFFADRPS